LQFSDQIQIKRRQAGGGDKLVGCVAPHARGYRGLLDQQWEQTEWTRGETDYVLRRLDNVLAQLPAARQQARERILHGQLVPSKEKILSLYEPDVQVIVRHKAGAEVEFGNTLLLGESSQGVIIDWELFKDVAPNDARLVSRSLQRIEEKLKVHVGAVGADRGFDSQNNQSVSENCAGSCGEGFWLWPRRRGPSIPNAGCKDRANAGHGQKTRRPEGFRAKGRLASLLLSRRSREDILLRRASPSGLWRENKTPRNFRTRSQQWLKEQKTYNAICPRSPKALKQRKKSWKFSRLQRRRSQCEGRIGIVKNNFLGRPLRSKGFASRELAVSWAVFTHNLWVIARLPQRKARPQTHPQALAA